MASSETTDPVEYLAQRLHFKAEHLDPTEDEDWGTTSERTREFYRALIRDLLCAREMIEAAWRAGA
jgi:hypothetical protein